MEAVSLTLWWNRGRLPEDNVGWDKLTPEGRVRASAPYWTHNMMVGIHEGALKSLVESKDCLIRELALDALEWAEHWRRSYD